MELKNRLNIDPRGAGNVRGPSRLQVLAAFSSGNSSRLDCFTNISSREPLYCRIPITEAVGIARYQTVR